MRAKSGWRSSSVIPPDRSPQDRVDSDVVLVQQREPGSPVAPVEGVHRRARELDVLLRHRLRSISRGRDEASSDRLLDLALGGGVRAHAALAEVPARAAIHGEDESGMEPLNPYDTLSSSPEPRASVLTLFRGFIRLQVGVCIPVRLLQALSLRRTRAD